MIYKVLGAAFAIAGADKLAGDGGYVDMFEQLGWSKEGMNAVGAAELAGGILMAWRGTRRLGAGVLAGASGAVLASELRSGRGRLAGPRGFLLAAALAALITPDRG